MSQNDIEEIELNIEECKEIISLSAALKRLAKNKDFEKVFLKGYLKDEAVRLVHLRADPSVQNNPSITAHVLRDIDGIGSLIGYMNKLHQQADMAQEAINANEEELELIRSGEAVH